MKNSLLFLSAHLPVPDGFQAGMKCSYHLCRILSRHFQVHLLCFVTDAELPQYHREPFTIFQSHELLPITNRRRAMGVMEAPGLPIAVGARNSREFRRRLSIALSQHKFSVAVLDHTAMWQYADQLSDIPLVCGVGHDVLTQLWERRAGSATGIAAHFLRFEAGRVRKWETAAVKKLDVVSPMSKKDAILLSALSPATPVLPIQPWFTNLAKIKRTTHGAAGSSQKNVIFWGALSREENQDAVRYSLEEILPIVRAQFPDVHFYIAGAASNKLRQTWSSPGVTVTGFVEDVGGLFSQMDIALLPLRLGAGIKIKVLECMSAGMAVVTTSVGIEGIPANEGTEYLLGNTTRELAAHVNGLLNDPIRRGSMGACARDFVEREFDFEIAAERLSADLISRICAPVDEP